MRIYHKELEQQDTKFLIPFIYNHTEMLYGSDNYLLVCEMDDSNICCGFHIENNEILLQSWDVDFKSQIIFNACIKYLFRAFSVQKINAHYSRFNYHNNLYLDCNYRIELPKSFEDLLSGLTKKERYNRKRERRLLEEQGFHFEEIEESDFDFVLNIFFGMKKKTHNRDWHLSPAEFKKTFNISNIYVLRNDEGKIIAIVLSDEQFDTVCFQNISYEIEYKNYAPGTVIYLYYLETLIEKGKSCVHLGGGGHEYKEKYCSIKEQTYNGCIERFWFGKWLHNTFLGFARKIKHLVLRKK